MGAKQDANPLLGGCRANPLMTPPLAGVLRALLDPRGFMSLRNCNLLFLGNIFVMGIKGSLMLAILFLSEITVFSWFTRLNIAHGAYFFCRPTTKLYVGLRFEIDIDSRFCLQYFENCNSL